MSSGKYSGFTETPAFTKYGTPAERKRSMFVVRGPLSVVKNRPMKDDLGDNRLSGCRLIEGAEQCRHVS